MKTRRYQRGFVFVELILVLMVLGAVVFVGYKFITAAQEQQETANIAQQVQQQATPKPATPVQAAPTINNTSDLDKAQQALDQTDTDNGNSTDTSQLDSQVGGF